MNKDLSTLSSFITKLDAEILEEDEAILLTGGFAPASTDDSKPNYGCNIDNCTCSIVTDNCKSGGVVYPS